MDKTTSLQCKTRSTWKILSAACVHQQFAPSRFDCPLSSADPCFDLGQCKRCGLDLIVCSNAPCERRASCARSPDRMQLPSYQPRFLNCGKVFGAESSREAASR